MSDRSPLHYDISVTADKRRRARQRGMSGAVDGSTRMCEMPGCKEKAAYRAPSSPENLSEYRWFCLNHVREYNRAWNFFNGWSQEDLDEQVRADRTWERPTWTFKEGQPRQQRTGPHSDGRAWSRWGFADPMDVLGESATQNPGAQRQTRFRRLTREEERAMDTLGLDHSVESKAQVRTRYRELVKDLHPDMNDGNRGDEARLGRVIRAWDILKNSRSFKE